MTLLAALVVGLSFPASGSAHKLAIDTAREEAREKAREIHRETDSESSEVTSCRRKERHKVLCKVRSTYSTGLQTCVTLVPVRYSGQSDGSPRASIGETVCS